MKPLDVAYGLYDHYASLAEVKHYYGLLAIYALARAAQAGEDEASTRRCEAILSRFPDEITHPVYNFPNYTIGGIPQAFLVAEGRMPHRIGVVREYAEEMLTAPRDPAGIMKHPCDRDAEKIWIDTAMAVSPYLLYAGLALRDERYLAEAVCQAVRLHDELLDPEYGLLHQCRGFVAPGAYSRDHWSRGNGWGYFALAELARGLPPESAHRAEVTKRFTGLSAALLPHQSRRGLWRQEIPQPLSYEESSGTGLILYGIGVGIRHGLLDPATYAPAFRRGVEGLARVCVNDDFSTERSCPGTLCPGEGDEKGTVAAYMTLCLPYRDEPHGCGPLMLAMVEAHLAGIADVSLRAAAEESR
ncbi:unsaturated rhamnogalacturonyl hydrolase [Thermocatellispora tengchongensis]|uniref:Unsaturated rhamnogalacturonyl hydrolase n=1 Tax=Thermocatellispora tengchongensis TaxID=1073253 RepID=A0A840NY19_9ACTN|nr:glycoside hydrolase family 88 protein [Thermocatellispora tengchongensis]MBB5133774.1 unsaturated rhamnogalacturonyl hydrolase [Thermocatellispora tengchongensis]